MSIVLEKVVAEKMRRLFAARRSGHTLPRALYVDSDAFDFDMWAIFERQWLQVALEVEIPNPGNYISLTIANSPIVILRMPNGGIGAYFNTCRHRGAKICQEERGHIDRFVCPYHQWTYDLSGKLTHARLMPDDFEKNAHHLLPANVEMVAGVIYVCLADDPPDFRPFRAALEPLLAPHELHKSKVAHTAVLLERANWKLVMENARECHHCRARHPKLMRTFRDFTTGDIFERPEPWLREFWSRCETKGLKSAPISGPWFEAGRFPLVEGAISLTTDGRRAVTKTLGQVGDGDVGTMRWAVQPNCFNHAFGDYAFFFQALPTGPQETTVTAKWVVHKDAQEGIDYDLDRLIEVWTATNSEDQWLAENNQRGVNSIAFVPGPYAPLAESRVVEFVDWYCAVAASLLVEDQAKSPR